MTGQQPDEPSPEQPDGQLGPRPDVPGRRWRRVLRRVAIGLVVLLVVAGVAGYLLVRHLDGNIATGGSLDQPWDHRPPKVEQPGREHQAVDVLVLGSDTRKGAGNHIGGDTPGLSDTTIVLHLAADRRHAVAVSIPRDSEVRRPGCRRPDGSRSPGGLAQFNEAYAVGGVACTAMTVEQLTGLHLDHYLVIDFNGFKQMVDALGGVRVCVPRTVDDPKRAIHFDAGTYDVTGGQALSYVRERYAVGDGSDIGRIRRQQAFLGSMAHQALSAGTLVNLPRLYRFLDAATRSLLTDPGLAHVSSLAGLARQFDHIGLDHIRFLTVPTEPYPPNPARVQWQQPAARQLWRKVRLDQPLSHGQRAASSSAQDPTHTHDAAALRSGLCP